MISLLDQEKGVATNYSRGPSSPERGWLQKFKSREGHVAWEWVCGLPTLNRIAYRHQHRLEYRDVPLHWCAIRSL